MIVINYFAGPGAGKSTAAAAAFVYLKKHSMKTELISEAARDMIYAGQKNRLDNQLTVSSKQYSKLDNLKRHGCDVVLSDSSLLLSKIYGKSFVAYKELCMLVDKLYNSFDNINVWVKRTKPYSTFGRVQETIEEAKQLDSEVYNIIPYIDLEITGDAEGHEQMCEYLFNKLILKGDK